MNHGFRSDLGKQVGSVGHATELRLCSDGSDERGRFASVPCPSAGTVISSYSRQHRSLAGSRRTTLLISVNALPDRVGES